MPNQPISQGSCGKPSLMIHLGSRYMLTYCHCVQVCFLCRTFRGTLTLEMVFLKTMFWLMVLSDFSKRDSVSLDIPVIKKTHSKRKWSVFISVCFLALLGLEGGLLLLFFWVGVHLFKWELTDYYKLKLTVGLLTTLNIYIHLYSL